MTHFPVGARTGLAALALFLACVAASGSLQAQVVSGRVVSVDSLSVIRSAFVQIFDTEGLRIGTALSNDEGRFEVRLERPGGPFRLQVDAFGFTRETREVPPLRADESVTLEDFVLDPAPIVLNELSVEVEPTRRTTGREWVRRNQLHGTGTFLAGALIAVDAPHSLGSYIADRTELWVRYNARGQPLLDNPRGAMSRCVDIMVNRWPLDRSGYRSIDEIPAGNIAAIEIYENDRDRPPGYYFEGRPGCGLIQVWLWNSW